ncbi:LPKTxAVK-anchored surface protein [Streptococcus marmotae]|uniref:LPKTxAVK-anchored surface protein n=1 Tax=Streptococcus marmotae TaxID=1825069 RepID=UPI000831A0CA|nr:LPKTxAVK-anchored surface protein [Streptococcus marmotae]
MKKKLFVTFAAAALVAAVAPAVLAEGNYSSDLQRHTQKTYVTWSDIAAQAVAYVDAHEEDVQARVAQDNNVVAAQAALNALNGYSGHDYEAKRAPLVAALEAAKEQARNDVRNAFIEMQQKTLLAAAKAESRYWEEDGKHANLTNEARIAEDKANQKGEAYDADKASSELVGDKAQPEMKPEEKAKAEEAVKKAATEAKKAEAGKKALPKTSAVK